MVSEGQKQAIRATWSGVSIPDAGRLFYVRLAAVAPDAYAVFGFGGEDVNTSAKVGAQGEKVMKFVDTAVKGLDDMGGVAKKLDDLGSRHTNYGAKKGHFVGAGTAFLETMEKMAGSKWNAEAKAGWTALYGVISDHITSHLSS